MKEVETKALAFLEPHVLVLDLPLVYSHLSTLVSTVAFGPTCSVGLYNEIVAVTVER